MGWNGVNDSHQNTSNMQPFLFSKFLFGTIRVGKGAKETPFCWPGFWKKLTTLMARRRKKCDFLYLMCNWGIPVNLNGMKLNLNEMKLPYIYIYMFFGFVPRGTSCWGTWWSTTLPLKSARRPAAGFGLCRCWKTCRWGQFAGIHGVVSII